MKLMRLSILAAFAAVTIHNVIVDVEGVKLARRIRELEKRLGDVEDLSIGQARGLADALNDITQLAVIQRKLAEGARAPRPRPEAKFEEVEH